MILAGLAINLAIALLRHIPLTSNRCLKTAGLDTIPDFSNTWLWKGREGYGQKIRMGPTSEKIPDCFYHRYDRLVSFPWSL